MTSKRYNEIRYIGRLIDPEAQVGTQLVFEWELKDWIGRYV